MNPANTLTLRREAARLLLLGGLRSIYDMSQLDLRRFRTDGRCIIDSFSAFAAATATHLPSPLPPGMTVISPGRVPLILYDPALPLPRRNFTIAHELGHLLLHHGTNRQGCTEGSPEEQERAADAFASLLLAPPVLIAGWEQLLGRRLGADEITLYFTVSKAASSRIRQALDRLDCDTFSEEEEALAQTLFDPILGEHARTATR